MKLIIQIPCYNEAETLPQTLAELPTEIAGIDVLEWLIIDDGSADATAAVAREHGVHHIVRHKVNKGLATAFQTGIRACMERGADIIVNTDADNQYPGRFIPALVQPILDQKADLVIGDRQTDQIEHFSPIKKRLQSWGSSVVRIVSQTDVPDAPSGFRAMTRDTALRFNIVTRYTYTLETIIQAGNLNLTIVSVPVQTNAKTRESRLIKSIPQYVARSAMTILRLFMLYKPLQTFLYLSLPFWIIGVGFWLRYFVLFITDNVQRGSNIQSVVVGAVAIILAFILVVFGFIGDLIAVNRRLHEESLYYIKRDALRDINLPTPRGDEQSSQRRQDLRQDPEQAV